MKIYHAALAALSFLLASVAYSQTSPLFQSLPVGKYPVGFKIVTIANPTRVTGPEYNYLGEKNEGDLTKKVTIHLWYPATAGSGGRRIIFEDYCFNNLIKSSESAIKPADREAQVRRRRTSMEGWFGKINDDSWKKLLATTMLASIDASKLQSKFPLLIGTLRPLSTAIANEMLASNGYVVAMINSDGGASFAEGALVDIPDMQFAIAYLTKENMIDAGRIGSFGFSGSGFSPMLFSMFDHRVKAAADIESGIYMDGLFQAFSASNYYNPSKLRKPFLHIFSRDLSKQEKYLHEFEKKTPFSKRYRLILNQPALHHWDFATEGYASATVLEMRGANQKGIQQAFETSLIYLLNFFNAELRSDQRSQQFLSAKPTIDKIDPGTWDITIYKASRPAPNRDEFEHIIRNKGITEALNIARSTIKSDSSTNLLQGFILNTLGYNLLNEKKYAEAIGVFTFNVELHPGDSNYFDSLSEAYELTGDKERMKTTSAEVIKLLDQKTTLNEAEKSLKETAERRLKG